MGGLVNLAGGILGETDSGYSAKIARQQSQKAQANSNALNTEATGLRQQALPTLSNLSTAGAKELDFGQSKIPGQFDAYLGATDANNANPYSLSPSEQTELNGHLDQLSKGYQGSLARYRAQQMARGITDPALLAAGEANLQQGHNALVAGHTAAFTNAARQNRVKAQETALQYLSGLTGQGASIANEGAGGIANLGAQATNAANAQAGQSVQQSQVAQQNTAQDANNLSGILNLAGFGLGGGFGNPFGGPATPAAPTPAAATGSGPLNNPGPAMGAYADSGYNADPSFSLARIGGL